MKKVESCRVWSSNPSTKQVVFGCSLNGSWVTWVVNGLCQVTCFASPTSDEGKDAKNQWVLYVDPVQIQKTPELLFLLHSDKTRSDWLFGER
jgi:hypothetical protein